MIGDQLDITGRLRSVLPKTWFPDPKQVTVIDPTVATYAGLALDDYNGTPLAAYNGGTTIVPSNSPVLDGLLSGVASVWTFVYSLLQFVKTQTRMATASGVFIDMIAHDFFGSRLARRPTETDAALLSRVKKELFREKGTRAAMIGALTDLTGQVPGVFEPAYPLDTGAYANGSLAYNTAGGYGSLVLPFQYFLTVFRPVGGGVASVAGYGSAAFAGMPGGYGVGSIEYIDISTVNSILSDQSILDTINDVKPAATLAWVRLSGGMVEGGGPSGAIWDEFNWDDGSVWQ